MRDMPNKIPRRNGDPAERAAARKYGLELIDGTTGFYDAVHVSNGRKVQIKSALYERRDGPGVFRIWREHLRELAQVEGTVVLAVVNPVNRHQKVLKVTKRSPRDLLEHGDFRKTGQQDMLGKTEARIPWPDLVTL